ncbi:tetratricopeptide repeat protein [Polyangium aurulentum]|uniref:tetratricopeptide repeat protein n=1 Tax=Polyangium aurulentum TaxID=2567896 RepID=UPI00146A8AE9|nr:tetratricopeptide repeat protein [Polyangium aurulentum]UQA55752.1 hypothetical protein E8A73_031015 [Polyangium aurulentum]
MRTFVALAIGTTAPAPALAESQPTEAQLQQAREQFARGRKLEDEGRWSEALPLFERVAAVKMTPQVRFHIALCLEKTGKLERAREGFEQAAREGKPTAPNVVAEAKEHLAALEKRIPTVTVAVAKMEPGDEVLLDGNAIAIGEPVAVDPGSHTLTLRRGGEDVSAERIDVAEGEPQRFELKGPAEGGKPPGPTGPVVTGADPGRTQRVLGWTALGVGAASAVGMGVFVALRAGALSELDAACPNHKGCDPSIEPIVSRGKTHATLVNVFAGISGLAVAGGVVLLLTAPSPPARAPAGTGSIRFVPGIGPGGAFVSLEGSF